MKIAITGSTGLVGTALGKHWSAAHVVLPAVRGPASAPASVWDPAAGWIRPGAFEGVDAVVHLAGASIATGRWTAERKAELVASRVEATRLLVAHLSALERKPSLLISASAVGYYGSRASEVLDETAAPGDDFLAKLCVDWEHEALAAEAAGIRTVIFRLGVIMAREGGALPKMLTPIKLGVGGKLGSGRQWMPWVSMRDVVGAHDFVLGRPAAKGVYNLTAPEPATNATFTKALGKAVHRPTVMAVPALALKAMLGAEAAQGMLLCSQRVVPRRLEAEGFGFVDRKPAEAFAALFGPVAG